MDPRQSYILRLALTVSLGSDDETATDREYQEAVAFLERAGIQVPVPSAPVVAVVAWGAAFPFSS